MITLMLLFIYHVEVLVFKVIGITQVIPFLALQFSLKLYHHQYFPMSL